MSGVNKAILVGHVGRDPEIRKTQAGEPIATFSLATSETWRDKATGERRERTEWHDVVVFGEQLYKVIEQYVKKGSKLYLEGAIKKRKYTEKQSGTEKIRAEIVLQGFNARIVMLDRAERAPDPTAESYGTDSNPTPPSGAAAKSSDDDEIPF